MQGILTSSDWLQSTLTDVVIPPPLYKVPDQGWLSWAAALSGVREAKAGTHSGRIIEARAPAWAQWIALKETLEGKDGISPEAQAVRQAFESGQALPLTAPQSVERFATFLPVLRYDPLTHTYQVGDGRTAQVLNTAHSHQAALDAGARWFDRNYETEIAYQRDRAQKETARLPAFYLDLLTAQLEYDGLLLTETGELVALLNGAHGFYLVASQTWCYTLQITPGLAAKMAIMGARDDGVRLLSRVSEFPTFVGLTAWQGDGEDGYIWSSGKAEFQGQGQWRVFLGGQPRAIVVYKNDQIKIMGRGSTELAASVIPPILINEEGASPALAWAVWRIARLVQQRASGKGKGE